MSNYTDGAHKTVLEGSIYPSQQISIVTNWLPENVWNSSVPLRKAYDTFTYYGHPEKLEDVEREGPPTTGMNPHDLGDGAHHDMHKALHQLLTGKLEMTETRKLLTDRQRRG